MDRLYVDEIRSMWRVNHFVYDIIKVLHLFAVTVRRFLTSPSGIDKPILLFQHRTNICREINMAARRPAYVIAEVEITDAAVFEEYVSKAVPTLAAANARIIARSRAHAKEGTAPVGEIVIVAFESLEDAERWYGNSPYADTIPIRQRSANTRLFIIEGEPL